MTSFVRCSCDGRLGERADRAPTRELPDLTGLADVLDDIVPPDEDAAST
jgi:hypothetical protein